MPAEAGVNAGLGGSSEAVPSTSHQKPHSGQHHSSHGKKHQHSAAGSEGGAGAPGSQALAGASGGSKLGAGGSAAVLASAMHDLAAAGGVPVPAPGPAGGPLAALLPPAGVRHSPTIGAASCTWVLLPGRKASQPACCHHRTLEVRWESSANGAQSALAAYSSCQRHACQAL